MSPRHAAGPAAARTAPAGMFHSAINILIRELSTHLANPGPRRDHVVSGGETPGVADVGDAHEPQEPTHNDLATPHDRSEEHTSELQSIMRSSYAVFFLKKQKHTTRITQDHTEHM